MLDRNWIADGYPDPQQEARNRAHAVDILTRFHRDNVATYSLPVALEERFAIEVDGVTVSGQIDRMDRHPDGTYEIIDYKTSRRLPSLTTVEESLQLSMYHLAARETWGIEPSTLTLYFVVHGQPLSTPGRTEAQIQAVRRHVVTIAERIDARRFEPKTSKLCDYCDYQPICPAFRSAGERRRGEGDAEMGARVDEWVRLADDAARAGVQLPNGPVYLLTHPEERVRLGIPHYRVGKLVRFKLHELMVWIESQQRFRRDPSQGGIDA